MFFIFNLFTPLHLFIMIIIIIITVGKKILPPYEEPSNIHELTWMRRETFARAVSVYIFFPPQRNGKRNYQPCI